MKFPIIKNRMPRTITNAAISQTSTLGSIKMMIPSRINTNPGSSITKRECRFPINPLHMDDIGHISMFPGVWDSVMIHLQVLVHGDCVYLVVASEEVMAYRNHVVKGARGHKKHDHEKQ
jgi:hypothetical protein